MKKRDIGLNIIIIIVIIFFIVNMSSINSFLSVQTDKTIELEHSTIVVPEAWNTTDELNISNQAKTDNAITNNYTIIDIWEDWPESNITSISNSKFSSLENGNFNILKTEKINLGGLNVSKEYFSNPSRDNEHQWDHIGVTYVFQKEDTNYSIEVHYFTTQDYNNKTYLKELDDRIEDIIGNIHNKNYNGFISGIQKLYSH
ncbi:hypothetical protein [uncultured Methanobrevibacter sp.]|uniref:hypothetical protein n=1 Tax=uncultured Methanobrevibacter sp. TaxID=253161 RepID=UPI0026370A09|nr:hypothetical protein [uncultured Methanobrevibacter sp.]